MEPSSDLFSYVGKEIIGPAIVGIIISISVFINGKIKRAKRPPSIKITAEKNDKIQEKLVEIRIRFQADRAYLGMIHNGTKYIEGSEMLKKSRTNESVAPGVSFEAGDYQNMLLSLVVDEMKLIAQEGASFTKVKDLTDGKFKRMCEARGIKALCRTAVRKGGDIIGYIGIDYNKEMEKPTNIEDLCSYAGIFEQILGDYSSIR